METPRSSVMETPRSSVRSFSRQSEDEEGDWSEGEQAEAAETDAKQESAQWVIGSGESVYNDGIFRIVMLRKLKLTKGWNIWAANIFAVTLLLAFNAALQLQVLSRVSFLVSLGMEDKQDVIFQSCMRRETASLPFPKHLAAQDWYWDCGPLMTTLLSNVSFLDVNGDDMWSEADDPRDLSNQLSRTYHKNGNLSVILRKFVLRAKEGKFLAQEGMSEAEWKAQTNDFSGVPMTWMKKDQPLIDLCMNTDQELCGNLERRGILGLKLGGLEDMSSSHRVVKCRAIMADCRHIYGEIYRYYAYMQEQRCGDQEFSYDYDNGVTITRYSVAAKYDRVGNKSAITGKVYEVFLALVLIIWWLVVVAEGRQVISWWMVIILKPEHPPEGTEETEEDDESIQIHSIPRTAKIAIFLTILLPRTFIVIGLSWVGSQFLIIADSYTDLILNSTALAFLTEIDESLFTALCSERTKAKLMKLQPITGVHSGHARFSRIVNLPTSLPIITGVVAVVSGFIFATYNEARGKREMSEAFSCLCHAEGIRCVAAQILGGSFHVPSSVY